MHQSIHQEQYLDYTYDTYTGQGLKIDIGDF